jgi:hypothetical protein
MCADPPPLKPLADTGWQAGVEPPPALVSAVAASVATDGGTWFQEFGGERPRLHFLGGQARPRCILYRFDLDTGRVTRPVVVKVRHSRPELRRLDRFEGQRPVLAPVRAMPDRDNARREYDGLRLIQEMLRDADPGRFGVLRPLAWLPEHAAIVMDLVEQPTLRSALLRQSRLRAGRRTPVGEAPWRNAGAWLRMFQTHRSTLVAPRDGAAPMCVGDLYREFGGFLVERIGSRPLLATLRDAGDEIAASALPTEPATGTAHSDFVANNMFLGAGGRITGFDPLPSWNVPCYLDLATLLVNTRVLPLQAASQGLALPSAALDRYEAAVLQGYFGTDAVPHTEVVAFQLLVLLEKWAAAVSKRIQRGRVRPHLHQVRMRLVSHFYDGEARRLFRALEGAGAAATDPTMRGRNA